MESCCRVCSRSDEFRRFSLYAVAEVSQEVIANMIRDTSDTQVSSEDGLPQHICPDCLMTLSLAYSFRKQCRRSDAKFREYWGGRTSQLIDQQQQLPRRSQSQAPDDSSFEAVTNIKEEVDIYDYEYSVPSQDNQWVIQNPRTIGEGAMTVVHNSGQYYDELAAAAAAAAANDGSGVDRDGSVLPMVTAHLDDPSEMGESSGLAQKGGEKWKKKPLAAERYSQRIRRQIPSRMKWTENQLSSAMHALRSGKSCRQAALISGISASTLERYRRNSKMSQLFQLPESDLTQLRGRWTKEQLGLALRAISSGMSHKQASVAFGIPRTTLSRNMRITKPKPSEEVQHMKREIKVETSCAPEVVISGEEKSLEPDNESGQSSLE